MGTVGGIGGSTILRGKYSVIGNEKDHLWMSISRFGMGRSVPGSVFSEGRLLSKDDEKTYWGKIDYEKAAKDAHPTSKLKIELDGSSDQRLLVKGSVLFGSGLEPLPVGLFILTETNSTEVYGFLDDDDDDDNDNDNSDDDENEGLSDGQLFFGSDNAFQ